MMPHMFGVGSSTARLTSRGLPCHLDTLMLTGEPHAYNRDFYGAWNKLESRASLNSMTSLCFCFCFSSNSLL